MVRPVRYLPWLALAVVGAFFVLPGSVSAQQPETPQLRVQGQGIVSVRPDVAIVTLGATVRRETSQQAFEDVNASVASLTQYLRAQGIAERDITTRQFSLSPEFNRPEGDAPARIIGWRGTNLVSVKLRDFATIGTVIDGGVRALGNDAQISGIVFTLEDNDAAVRQAREQAIAEARQNAEQIAAAAGVRLIRILSISETFAPPPMPVALAAAAPAARAVAEVSPGEQSVSVSVEIVYEIG